MWYILLTRICNMAEGFENITSFPNSIRKTAELCLVFKKKKYHHYYYVCAHSNQNGSCVRFWLCLCGFYINKYNRPRWNNNKGCVLFVWHIFLNTINIHTSDGCARGTEINREWVIKTGTQFQSHIAITQCQKEIPSCDTLDTKQNKENYVPHLQFHNK